MKTLDDFIKENSKFLKLEDGGSYEGYYKGFKVVPNKYDPDKEQVVYKLEDKEGRGIYFQTASVAVAKAFNKLGKGGFFKITRHGVGTSTSYEISIPEDFSKPEYSGDPEIEEI